VNHSTVLRWAVADDFAALGEVMFAAVRQGQSPYSEAQRAAWTPAPRSGPAWQERLAAQQIVVAEADGRIVGFMSLAAGGYVDFAYIRPEARGAGLFRRLYECIEVRAQQVGVSRLWAHASLMAEPAFAAMGFRVIQRESVDLSGQQLSRATMEKRLTGEAASPGS
jgi:putative acetyltransferase